MIRVGLVGYGFAGRGFHARLVGRVPGLKLTAVATRDDARRALATEEHGVVTFATLEKMLAADACDVVVLATPHDVHTAQALTVIAARKHVVIDKPMCLTTADANRLLGARDRAGVLLSVFHNRRWDWDYLTVKQIIDEGLIGVPSVFETSVLRYKAPRGWRAGIGGGGILVDWGAHLVDQALMLVPSPLASVSCDEQHIGWGSEAGSYVRLQMRFQSGVLYSVEIGNLAAIPKPRWYVQGRRGALVKMGLDPQEPALLAGQPEAATERPEERTRIVVMGGVDGAVEHIRDSVRGDWTGYYENLRDAILGKAPLAVTGEQARQVVAVLEAAGRSAESHQPVLF